MSIELFMIVNCIYMRSFSENIYEVILNTTNGTDRKRFYMFF